MTALEPLTKLTAGMEIVVGGQNVTRVSEELASAFAAGDRLITVQSTGDLLHIPSDVAEVAHGAVDSAFGAFEEMGNTDDEAITTFFTHFADNLAEDTRFQKILEANQSDISAAKAKGRSTTRLELTPQMRSDMIEGLRGWAGMESERGQILSEVDHQSWKVELRKAGLGVVGFVFEGRPNVFADACGVIRSGNTVVFRIGSDALGTALAIVEHALDPAIESSGLPKGAATLVPSAERSAGWAMFCDDRISLAVVRGSGKAVEQLGAVARQSGIDVSLHGTGGAWIVTGAAADAEWVTETVAASLDRKVCNTLNTFCVLEEQAEVLIPAFLDGVRKASEARGANPKLHLAEGSDSFVPDEWKQVVEIARAEGLVSEPGAESISRDALGVEWEWEDSPEVTLVVVSDVAEAAALFNQQAPNFVASIITSESSEFENFYGLVDAPFVGNGFTRWVDGQYALGKPELGLSNWQSGRLFGRGAVLSGDSVYTVRAAMTQRDATLKR